MGGRLSVILGNFYDPDVFAAIQLPGLREPICHGMGLRPPELVRLESKGLRYHAGTPIFYPVLQGFF